MNFKKILLSTLALLAFFLAAVLYMQLSLPSKPSARESNPSLNLPTPEQTQEPKAEESPAPKTPEEPKELPQEFLLEVPFTPQAPTANWDQLHEEACEEASVIMAAAFFQGDTRSTLPAPEVEASIKKLTTWQEKNFGYSLSINSEEAAQMIEAVYGLNAEVVRDFSEDSLKKTLAENKLILVPANGRKLGNPNFKPPGPIYHMLVITGYDEKSFITNDPGTKRGQNYRYSFQTIRNAIGDYSHKKKETDPTKPAIIVVSK